MSAASRAALRTARLRRAERTKRIFLISIGVVVALFVLAFLMTRAQAPITEDGVQQTAAVSIGGASLPEFEATEGDPAVGMTLPEISGEDFYGEKVAIRNDGKPKVVMFLAHWCPHCQKEVPVVQAWLAEHGLAHDVGIYSVATATSEAQPNYPPSDWLEREGWTVPVIADDGGSSAGDAAGVSSYPFFVFVNADGTVSARAAGELSTDTIEAAIAALGRR